MVDADGPGFVGVLLVLVVMYVLGVWIVVAQNSLGSVCPVPLTVRGKEHVIVVE